MGWENGRIALYGVQSILHSIPMTCNLHVRVKGDGQWGRALDGALLDIYLHSVHLFPCWSGKGWEKERSIRWYGMVQYIPIVCLFPCYSIIGWEIVGALDGVVWYSTFHCLPFHMLQYNRMGKGRSVRWCGTVEYIPIVCLFPD